MGDKQGPSSTNPKRSSNSLIGLAVTAAMAAIGLLLTLGPASAEEPILEDMPAGQEMGDEVAFAEPISTEIVEHDANYSNVDTAPAMLTISLRTSGPFNFRQVFIDFDQSPATGYDGGYDVLVENGFVYRYVGPDGQAEWAWEPAPITVEGSTGPLATDAAVTWSFPIEAFTAHPPGDTNYLVRVTSSGGEVEAAGVASPPSPRVLAITNSSVNYDAASGSLAISFDSTGQHDRKIVLIDADNDVATGYGGGHEILVENGYIHRHSGPGPDAWQWDPAGSAEGPLGADALGDNVRWTLTSVPVQIGAPVRFVVEHDGSSSQAEASATVGGTSDARLVNLRPFRPTDDGSTFANPERGLYLYTKITNNRGATNYVWEGSVDFEAERQRGRSLVLLLVELESEVGNAQLSADLKATLAQTLQRLDAAGFKAVFRARYKSDIDDVAEPEMGRIKQHISELAAIIGANRSAVAYVEAGMLGAWGEWHSSNTYNLEDNTAVAQATNDVVGAWTAELGDMYVGVRRPRFKVDSGLEDLSMVAHYNDCFLKDSIHAGTYDDGINLAGSQARAYLQGTSGAASGTGDTSQVPIGGETCGLDSSYAIGAAGPIDRYSPDMNSLGDVCEKGQRALSEYRYTYLHNRIDEQGPLSAPDNVNSYWPYQWFRGGCWEAIQQNLGYRFDLESVTLSGSATTGNQLRVSIEVANEGYARLYRSRPVELVFLREGRQHASVVMPGIDPSQWLPGRTTTQDAVVTIAVPAGSYTLGLRLADPTAPANTLHAIRFDNLGWNSDLGAQEFTPAPVELFSEPTVIVNGG